MQHICKDFSTFIHGYLPSSLLINSSSQKNGRSEAVCAWPWSLIVPYFVLLIICIQPISADRPFTPFVALSCSDPLLIVVHHKTTPPHPAIQQKLHVALKSRTSDVVVDEVPACFVVGIQSLSEQVVVFGPAMDPHPRAVFQVVSNVYVSSAKVKSAGCWCSHHEQEEEKNIVQLREVPTHHLSYVFRCGSAW